MSLCLKTKKNKKKTITTTKKALPHCRTDAYDANVKQLNLSDFARRFSFMEDIDEFIKILLFSHHGL